VISTVLHRWYLTTRSLEGINFELRAVYTERAGTAWNLEIEIFAHNKKAKLSLYQAV
jgi:hypothetical protein